MCVCVCVCVSVCVYMYVVYVVSCVYIGICVCMLYIIRANEQDRQLKQCSLFSVYQVDEHAHYMFM